jgi:hypothetical protein
MAGVGSSNLEAVNVDIRDQMQQLPANLDRATPERAPRDVYGLMKVVRRRRRQAVAPEHVHRLLAVKAMTRCKREELHELARLPQPPRLLRHQHTVNSRPEAPEEGNADVTHPGELLREDIADIEQRLDDSSASSVAPHSSSSPGPNLLASGQVGPQTTC